MPTRYVTIPKQFQVQWILQELFRHGIDPSLLWKNFSRPVPCCRLSPLYLKTRRCCPMTCPSFQLPRLILLRSHRLFLSPLLVALSVDSFSAPTVWATPPSSTLTPSPPCCAILSVPVCPVTGPTRPRRRPAMTPPCCRSRCGRKRNSGCRSDRGCQRIGDSFNPTVSSGTTTARRDRLKTSAM
jgi:hypothetical protein